MPGKLIIIGGGAAGFFCAVNAARLNPALRVTIVEKTGKLLSKVKVSGGGRCNVTHACFEIAEMARRYPRGGNFVKKSFHQFFTTDTVQWFRERSVQLKTEADGRMFPVTDNSQTIIDCLMREADRYAVTIRMNTEIRSMKQSASEWILTTAKDEELHADHLVIASGGFPKLSMFGWLQSLGHGIEPPVPSLFTFNTPAHPITSLMGISVPQVKLKIAGTRLQQEGPVLITHWGLSGPAILKLSAWGARELAAMDWKFTVIVNWVPSYNEQNLRDKLYELRITHAAQKTANKNPFELPQRLWDFILTQSGINGEKRWADLPARNQHQLAKHLCNDEYAIQGKTTFKEEFVTAGGIRTSEIDVATMESKRCSQLYFAGEIMDVDGITGGYNFQHAWTSGFIAGKTIAERTKEE